MKRSSRGLTIDMTTHRVIFQNNQITLFPCITFIRYLKQWVPFTVKDNLDTFQTFFNAVKANKIDCKRV